MPLSTKNKVEIITEYGNNQYDTGSSEVQIALLTVKINQLKNHFLIHKKDFHGRRGFLKKITQRRKQLNYLKYKDYTKYNMIIEKLGLRR